MRCSSAWRHILESRAFHRCKSMLGTLPFPGRITPLAIHARRIAEFAVRIMPNPHSSPTFCSGLRGGPPSFSHSRLPTAGVDLFIFAAHNVSEAGLELLLSLILGHTTYIFATLTQSPKALLVQGVIHLTYHPLGSVLRPRLLVVPLHDWKRLHDVLHVLALDGV